MRLALGIGLIVIHATLAVWMGSGVMLVSEYVSECLRVLECALTLVRDIALLLPLTYESFFFDCR